MARPLLQARHFSVRYLTRREAALRSLDLTVHAGERVLVGGVSGSGKSTFTLCAAGLIPGSIDADMAGEIRVAGRPTTEYGAGELARQVGIVFQDPASQFTMLTVGDEVAFGLENIGLDAASMRSRVLAALTTVGLADRIAWRLDRLSGGQQQRVVLAASLAMQPEMLVLDEPTAHLDPRAGTELYAHLRHVADRMPTTLFVVEHDTDKVIPSLAARCLLLNGEGQIVADRPVCEMFGAATSARFWRDAGLALPSPTALALALGEDGDLPISADAAASWLAYTPSAQHRLSGAKGERVGSGAVVLAARDLWQCYRTSWAETPVLHGVGLMVREGEFVAVVGRNGSGKTTLLRALSGLVPLDRGTVRIDSRDPTTLGSRTMASLVAHVFQEPERGFVAATVADELAFGPRALGWRAAVIDDRVSEALTRFDLTSVARANPHTLSGGQKRRLSVAATLLPGPRVLLLDEPTFGQDRRSAHALRHELARLRAAGLAVVAATHDTHLIAEEADRVIALVDGAVVFDGTPTDFFATDDLLAMTGQDAPVLRRILTQARDEGADVPVDLRWRDIHAVENAAAAQMEA
ncbi:MAG: energy-coupling factor ABC transporter ATP-binding protein [Chloroflexota bacterium]|nr:energy-coupling factor ABC transporter ATP-binding protein [Chloroflexota bacterium]